MSRHPLRSWRRRRWAVWFYNLDNHRPNEVMVREVAAILSTRPAILGFSEAVGYDMPEIDGYRLIRQAGKHVPPGRENIGAYVRDDIEVTDVTWTDQTQTWSRTEGPGTHWPRSILTFRADGILVAVVHQPPLGTDNSAAAQAEGINALLALNPDIVIGDMNRKPGSTGPGPTVLARHVGARTVGDRIDCAVVHRSRLIGRVRRVRYPVRAGRRRRHKVRLRSDHGHAFRFTLVRPKEHR